MILIIRGHIRNSFENKILYNLIKEIYDLFPDLKIFIHTWNIYCNNLSWRIMDIDSRIVNEELIYEYFDDLKHIIHNIIIDDDTKIQLIGNLNGNINDGFMPIKGWKNYWYGKYKIIDFLKNKLDDDNKEPIINFRFDIMRNSSVFEKQDIIQFIKKNSETTFTKNIFLFNDENHFGIDNIYMGNINTMHILIHYFFYELDDILSKNKDTVHQELLVYRINSLLFE